MSCYLTRHHNMITYGFWGIYALLGTKLGINSPPAVRSASLLDTLSARRDGNCMILKRVNFSTVGM